MIPSDSAGLQIWLSHLKIGMISLQHNLLSNDCWILTYDQWGKEVCQRLICLFDSITPTFLRFMLSQGIGKADRTILKVRFPALLKHATRLLLLKHATHLLLLSRSITQFFPLKRLCI
jgi:hypothetical protein